MLRAIQSTPDTMDRERRGLGRGLLRLLLFVLATAGLPLAASAALHVDITGGNIQPVPIAIPGFLGSGNDQQLGSDVAGVIAADLKRSGLFAPLDKASFIEKIAASDQTPRFADWRVI